MNEFKNQKEEIISSLLDLSGHMIDNNLVSFAIHSAILINDIRSLKPPALPTCSTCGYLNQFFSYGAITSSECGNEKASFNYLKVIHNTNKHICIHHSDYEVKDE